MICPVSSAYTNGVVSFAWTRYIGCWLLTGHCSGYLFPGYLLSALFGNEILICFMFAAHKKLVLRYVPTKWMAPNKCCETFFWIGATNYTKASPSARKMLLFSAMIITVILSCAIIKIYIILHIYLQVSETERLAELHWVIGQKVLDKTNSKYFHGISLAFSRMFF